MSISQLEKANMVYDHYKDTNQMMQNVRKKRDRLFYIVLVIGILILFFSISPHSLLYTATQWLKNEHHIEMDLQLELVQTLLWVTLFLIVSKYYRLIINLERLYQYIHNLENVIVDITGLPISREGEHYLNKYPHLLNYVDFIYKWIIPFFCLTVVIIKLASEWAYNLFTVLTVLDTLLALASFTTPILFLIDTKRR